MFPCKVFQRLSGKLFSLPRLQTLFRASTRIPELPPLVTDADRTCDSSGLNRESPAERHFRRLKEGHSFPSFVFSFIVLILIIILFISYSLSCFSLFYFPTSLSSPSFPLLHLIPPLSLSPPLSLLPSYLLPSYLPLPFLPSSLPHSLPHTLSPSLPPSNRSPCPALPCPGS